MTDLYPTLVLWRSQNGWTYLLQNTLSGVHPDDRGHLELEVVEGGRRFTVTVQEEK